MWESLIVPIMETFVNKFDQFLLATGETLYMVVISLFFATLIGVPIGVLLVITSENHLMPQPIIYKTLGTIVNIFRSAPYIVLILWFLPVSRWLIGTSFGPNAAIFSLVAGSAPFIGRLVETAIREVNRGVIEAAQAMGATNWEIIRKVLIPESLPAIVSGLTVTAVGLVGYSAMAGVIGSGGLGAMAWIAYNSFDNHTLFICTVLLVVIVQLIQSLGDGLVRMIDKR